MLLTIIVAVRDWKNWKLDTHSLSAKTTDTPIETKTKQLAFV